MRLARTAALAAALLLGLSACGGPTTPTAPICSDATTCPLPGNACLVATCSGGQCGQTPRPAGTKISDPTPGDCRSNQCDGAGNLAAANDAADLPSATSDCTTGTCVAGTPGQQPKTAGSACTSNGGIMCDGAGTCVGCLAGSDCPSGVCAGGTCQAPSCADLVKNGTETDVDCGGACPTCGDGKACGLPADCQSGVCTAGSCRVPSCADLVKNGAETDVDCGGPCAACAPGKACTANGDCSTSVCTNNLCASPQGAACVTNGACATGLCVDNVCCNTACAGGCQQCNLPGQVGTCANSLAFTDPRNACTASAASSCGSTDFCNGAGSCAVWSSATVCKPGTCNAGVVTPPGTCDGAGTCRTPPSGSCAPYVCGGSACLTSCSGNADCAPPATCQSNNTCL